ncbi:MAG: DUF4145 domain-containing protein [Thermodesulfobacteriota bacterium]
MKCPHCLENFLETERSNAYDLGEDSQGIGFIIQFHCPSCDKYILYLQPKWVQPISGPRVSNHGTNALKRMFYPKGTNRPPLSPDVTSKYADDYIESCLVISDSPKASAALSRRCLQNLIREHFSITKNTLADEINELMTNSSLPSHILDVIDPIREYGNFSAHPTKNISTGEIIDVEPGEAEWLLEILECLFDFCFVVPARNKARKNTLDSKLKSAGKKPSK